MENKEIKRKSTVAWVMTIIVVVLAILSAVIGIFGLIQGYGSAMGIDRVNWFSITSIVLGAVVAILAGWTFTWYISNKYAWWAAQIVWTLSSIGLIVVGIAGAVYISNKGASPWMPVCVAVNGFILLGDKIQYLIAHFARLAKEAKKEEVL